MVCSVGSVLQFALASSTTTSTGQTAGDHWETLHLPICLYLGNENVILNVEMKLVISPALCNASGLYTQSPSVFIFHLPSEHGMLEMNPTLIPFPIPDAAGMTCNGECEPSRRCWGPDDTNCVACVNYRYTPLRRCVPICEEYK